MRGIHYRHFLIYVLILLFQVLSPGYGQTETTSEVDVKAAYIFNFAKFVEWPEKAFASKTSPIVLCVLGDDPVGESLTSLENKKIKGRSLMVIREPADNQIASSHILYICDSERKNVIHILSRLAGKSSLTVGSIKNFPAMGGMIGFIRKGNNIRFEVNLEAVNNGNLSISSRLLNLAQIVKGSGGASQR